MMIMKWLYNKAYKDGYSEGHRDGERKGYEEGRIIGGANEHLANADRHFDIIEHKLMRAVRNGFIDTISKMTHEDSIRVPLINTMYSQLRTLGLKHQWGQGGFVMIHEDELKMALDTAEAYANAMQREMINLQKESSPTQHQAGPDIVLSQGNEDIIPPEPSPDDSQKA